MGHSVIKIDGEWAIRTQWTQNYREVNATLKRIPGIRFDGNLKVWKFKAPEAHLLQIISVFKALDIPTPKEILDKAASQAQSLDQGARGADERALDPRLYAFQVEGVRTLSRMNQWLLADDPGLGKTAQAILAIPDGSPVLCVVPAVVKGNWAKEFKTWRPNTFRVEILEGRNSFRFPNPGEVLITNWDILPASCSNSEDIDQDFADQVPEGLVVIGDEIHQAKNPKALRTTRYRTLNKLALEHGGRCWGLTGTPLLNRPLELWTILENLGLQEKAFGSFPRFYRLFNAYSDGYGTVWGLPEPEVPGLLEQVMLRREKSKVLKDLPPKRWQQVEVPIQGKVRTALDNLQQGMKDGAIRVLKNGLPGFEDMSEQRAALAEAKIPALLEIVESYEEQDTPVVVFSAHRSPIDVLEAREGWAVITGDTSSADRTQIVQDFQDGKYKGLGATIKAGGVGLTLTRASNMIFVDLEWVPALNTQAEDRIHRISQSDGCFYQILVADHPIDRLMEEKLSEKTQMIEATLKSSTSQVANGALQALDGVKVEEKIQEVQTHYCPMCSANLLPQVSHSEKNPGRPYVSCKSCNYFSWLDEAREDKTCMCPRCRRVAWEGVVKKEGKNQGRRYVNCPVCKFVWLDPAKKAEKKLSRSEQVVYGKRNYGDTKGSNTVVRQDYTEAQKMAMIEDLHRLLVVCDGASQKDFQGFNAPDAPIARLYAKAIQEGQDVNWKGLEDMLHKYRSTQLEDRRVLSMFSK